MRRMSVIVVMLAFVLAGCDAQSSPPQPTGPTTAETTTAETTEPGADPSAPADDAGVPAESAVPSTEPPAEASAGELEFLEAVGTAWRGDLPEEGELLRLGQAACDDIRSGTAVVDVNVVEGEGEARDQNNDELRLAALHLLCPDLVQS